MRVAVVTTSFPADTLGIDPAGHFVQTEVLELERTGNEVVVLRPETGGAFGWPGAAVRLRAKPWRALDAATWMARTSRRLREIRPDRIVAHWAVPSAWPIVLGG